MQARPVLTQMPLSPTSTTATEDDATSVPQNARLSLSQAQQTLGQAHASLAAHERRYPKDRWQSALLHAGGSALRREYVAQDGLRRALADAERNWLQLQQAENASTPAAGSDGPASASEAADLDSTESSPPNAPFVGTLSPVESRVTGLSVEQQARHLAAYLRLPHQAPTTGSDSSSLRLTLAKPTPIWVSAAQPSTQDVAAALSSLRLGEATASAVEPELQVAQNLLRMRDAKALSPRDIRGLHLAIDVEAARARAERVSHAAKQELIALDVPDDIARVFGEEPADYFDLPVASNAFYDAVLAPRWHPQNLVSLLQKVRTPSLEESSAPVVRWEDSSKQKHVFIRFFEPLTERAGLVTLQQFVSGAPQADGLSSSAWRVLDPYRFRSRELRHFADTIIVGASRRLNRLQLKKEVRELLCQLRTLVHERQWQEPGFSARCFVLGHPPWAESAPLPATPVQKTPSPSAVPSVAVFSPAPFSLAQDDSAVVGSNEAAFGSPPARGRMRTLPPPLRPPLNKQPWHRGERSESSASSSTADTASRRNSLDDDGIFTMSPPKRVSTPPSPTDSQKTLSVPHSPITPRASQILPTRERLAGGRPSAPVASPPRPQPQPLKSSLRTPSTLSTSATSAPKHVRHAIPITVHEGGATRPSVRPAAAKSQALRPRLPVGPATRPTASARATAARQEAVRRPAGSEPKQPTSTPRRDGGHRG